MGLAIDAVAGRSCGSCSLCCRLPEIDALSKPANEWCRNCRPGLGCAIYEDRPLLCRDFLCAWMLDADLDPAWAPSRSHMMVYEQGPQITVLVDPGHPDIWKQEPYRGDLHRWAADAAPTGGFVIVYVGDDCTKITPPAAVL